MQYPNQKKFAFTIIDDTDNDNIQNTRPVYEFLHKMGFKTTKTVWSLPPQDRFRGYSLNEYRYRQYIKKLQREGSEIALHGVSSGKNSRQNILDGLELFRQFIGEYPKIQINHAHNPDNIYWGIKRFAITKPIWALSNFKGDDPKSVYFWGDYHKKYIKFSRNLVFDKLNTTKVDKFMPYCEKDKRYANYWFSAANGQDIEKFNRLVRAQNINKLVAEGGTAIVFTHFASGFVKGGRLDKNFQKNMTYLARRDGWFVPVGEILNFLLEKRGGINISTKDKIALDLKWVLDKII